MDLKQAFGAISVLFAFAQYVPYIRDVAKGSTKPHAFSWFVWSLPCAIVYAAQIVKGGEAGSWATGVSTVLCTIIFILCFWRGEKNITRSDSMALGMGLVAIGLWVMTKDPLSSVILITIADVIGFIPTIRKSITKPYEETMSVYAVGTIKWVFSIVALSSLTASTLTYPMGMIVANSCMVIFLFCRRKSA